MSSGRALSLLMLLFLVAASPVAAGQDWIRPGMNTNQPVWGIRGGLLWAVAPAGFRPGEPRGLIRLGYPVLPEKRYDLINFIAIEPIVGGHRGFSELEHSQLDGVGWQTHLPRRRRRRLHDKSGRRATREAGRRAGGT